MKLVKVDPRRIKWPDIRVTARFDDEKGAQFEESIKTIGIDEPIKLFLVDGELIGSDGWHRCFEAIRNGINPVDAYVREGTMEDVLCNNLMAGHLRGKHPVSEMRRSIEALNTEFGYDSEKIAAKTGLTRDHVENIMAINELTPLILELLDQDKLSVGICRELTRLSDPGGQEKIALEAANFGWKIKDVRDVVNQTRDLIGNTLPLPPPAQPQPRAGVACTYCQREYDPSVVKMICTCPGCFGYALDTIRAAMREVEKAQIPQDIPSQVTE